MRSPSRTLSLFLSLLLLLQLRTTTATSIDTNACSTDFQGVAVSFSHCQLSDQDFKLYYTVSPDGLTVDTLFEANTTGYVSFAWGYSSMLSTSSASPYHALVATSSSIQPFALLGRTSDDVVPSDTTAAQLSDLQVHSTRSTIAGRFTRALRSDPDSPSFPSLTLGDEEAYIWAFGQTTGADDVLAYHTSRGVGSSRIEILETDPRVPTSSTVPPSPSAQPSTDVEPTPSPSAEQPTPPPVDPTPSPSAEQAAPSPVQPTPSPSAALTTSSPGDSACQVTLAGEQTSFSDCVVGVYGALNVYYTAFSRRVNNRTLRFIDTLFTAPISTQSQYASFGWGYSSMISTSGRSIVMFASATDGENPNVQPYELTDRSSSGVTPVTFTAFTDSIVEVSDGLLRARYTHPVESDTDPLDLDALNLIWATGELTGTTVGYHGGEGRGFAENVGVSFVIDRDDDDTEGDTPTPSANAPALLPSPTTIAQSDPSASASPAPPSSDPSSPRCVATFAGEVVQFASCDLEQFAPLKLYFSVVNATHIDTLFTAPVQSDAHYASFGWGYNAMIGGDTESVAMLASSIDGTVDVQPYSLTAKVPSGVQPKAVDDIVDRRVEIDDGLLAARFTYPVSAAGVASVDLEQDEVDVIWATGPMTADAVGYHTTTRGFGKVSLSRTTGTDDGDVDEPSDETMEPSSAPTDAATVPAPSCTTTFNGEEIQFAGCALEQLLPIQLYYTVLNETDDDGNSTTFVDTLFAVPVQDGAQQYASFGWGYNQMLAENGSIVMLASSPDGAAANAQPYILTDKASEGVQPTEVSDFSNTVTEISDGMIKARYRHPVSSEVLADVDITSADYIWAVGSGSAGAPLEYHGPSPSRGSGNLDLTAATDDDAGGVPAGSPEPSSCLASFQGEEVGFAGCELSRFAPVKLYYNLEDGTDGTGRMVDTLFTAPLSSATASDFVSFGWGYSDMVVGDGSFVMVATSTDGEQPVLKPFNLTGKVSSEVIPSASQPSADTYAVEIADGELRARYSHRIDSQVTPNFDVTEAPLIWATGSADGDVLEYHSASRGSGVIDLTSGVSESSSSGAGDARRARAHSVLMAMSWVVAAPLAVLSMAFFRKTNPLAFYVHVGCNVAVTLLTVTGLLLVVFQSEIEDIGTRGQTHRIIGYIVTAAVIAQSIAGAARPGKDASSRSLWYNVHRAMGIVLVCLGFVNVFFGISLEFLGDSQALLTAWYALAGITGGLYFLTAVFLALNSSKFPYSHDAVHAYKEARENGGAPAP